MLSNCMQNICSGQGAVSVWVAGNGHAALLVALQSIASKTAPVLREDGRWWWSSGLVL
jgi:hypothetical protein